MTSAYPTESYGGYGGPAAYRGPGVPLGVDPTKALWRRIFAYVIDASVGWLIVVGVATALGNVDTMDARRCPDDLDDERVCLDLTSGTGDDDDQQILLIDTDAVLIAAGAGLAWVLLNNVLVQGATGATVGKFITGARVVRPDGGLPGIGKALGRTLTAHHRHHHADPAARPVGRDVLPRPPPHRRHGRRHLRREVPVRRAPRGAAVAGAAVTPPAEWRQAGRTTAPAGVSSTT